MYFLLREWAIFVLDHPEQELSQHPDPVMLGVLTKRSPFLREAALHRIDRGVHVDDREFFIREFDEPPPPNQDVRKLVRSR